MAKGLVLAGELELAPAEAADLLTSYPETTLMNYDLGPSSGANRIGPTEIGRLIVIEPLSQAVAIAMIETGSSAPWSLVSTDARLEDADPESDIYWDAARLFGYFTAVPGIADAIASKLLHLKRPGFFPILDSVVRDLYRDAAKAAYGASIRPKRELPDAHRLYWAAIREDLVRDDTRDALASIRTILREDTRPHARAIASLSAVRILDMLAWQKRGAP
jgi:hypothetical protein